MLTDDENDFDAKRLERIRNLMDAKIAKQKLSQYDATKSEEWIAKTVPVFTRILDQAFRRAGLVKSKAMTNLIKDIISTHPNPSIEETTRIIQDLGDFSREAGFGPNPFK